MNLQTTSLDPFGITSAFMKIHEFWMKNPPELFGMISQLSADVLSAGAEQLNSVRLPGNGSAPGHPDPELTLLSLIKDYSKLVQKYHGLYSNWLKGYVARAEGVPDKEKQRGAFWTTQLINATSPSNWFWTNPAVVQKFMRTKGESALRGYENWIEDVQRGDSLIRIADTKAFKIGENLATSPGQVIFRNRLMELIQYSPKTKETYSLPVLIFPPWINKYYILDLAEQKSMVSHLIERGFTVFMISWKNPSSEMRDVTFDDYIFRGALKAVEVVREICGVDQVQAVGYCIGGTALTTLMAWLNREAPTTPNPIRHFTLFASLVDYSSPGELEVFIGEEVIKVLEKLMKKEGYLDKKYMATAFRLLRSGSLMWRYYVHNYLSGEVPPKSDYLFWNSDPTRLPEKMCSFYLREFYLDNKLIKPDALVVGNRPINLQLIDQPVYVVGAEQDHICPWTETFKIGKYVKGPVRFALSDEGHITGIVNPPSTRSKRKYWCNDVTEPIEPNEWLSRQHEQQGSWWVDWVKWLSERSDSRREPPPMGSPNYPPLEKAPGSYVLEQ